MAIDIELYRRTLFIPFGRQGQKLRRISVIDMQPEGEGSVLLSEANIAMREGTASRNN